MPGQVIQMGPMQMGPMQMGPMQMGPLCKGPVQLAGGMQWQIPELQAHVVDGAGAKLEPDRIRTIFRRCAPSGRLQGQQMKAFLQAVANEGGLNLIAFFSSFPKFERLFPRYDSSGDNLLDEVEAVTMVRDMLKHCADCCKKSSQGGHASRIAHKNLSDRYFLGKKLGEGGGGAVYLATSKSSREDRVVKFFDKHSATAAAVDDVVREVQMLKSFDHPRIQQVYDIFQDHNKVYVIYAPLRGGDLTTLVLRAQQAHVPVNVGWLAGVQRQMLEGVDYLHSRRVLHCDLKEQNVMITSSDSWSKPSVQLIDFGLASRFCSEGTGRGGTPGYMPPEVWTHELWTPRGDVHNLGVIMFQLFTGQQCYAGVNIHQLEFSTLRQQPQYDSVARYANLEPLLRQMLHKDFHRRPTVAGALRHSFFAESSASERNIPDHVIARLQKFGNQSEFQRVVMIEMAASFNLAEMNDMTQAFDKLDLNHDGMITIDEARSVLKAKLSHDQIEELVRHLGNAAGQLPYTRFMAAMLAQHPCLSRERRHEMFLRCFKAWDRDGNHKLDCSEIQQILEKPEFASQVQPMDEIMTTLDEDGDGFVSFEELQRAFARPSATEPHQVAVPGAKDGLSSGDYHIGQAVSYFSASKQQWVPTKVTNKDKEGQIQVECKPGRWLPKLAQQKVIKLSAS